MVFLYFLFVARDRAGGKVLLSCPAKAGKGDRALARWKGRRTQRHSFDDGEAKSQTPPPPCFAWSPSPAIAGADGRSRSRRANAPEVLQLTVRLKSEERVADGKRRGGTCRFLSATLASPSIKRRKRNADRRSGGPRAVPPGTAAHPAGCARLSAFHRGSDPRELSSLRPSSRPCFLGRGGAPICNDPPSGGQHRTQFMRALPALDLSQSSEHLAPQSL
jgi:hypothetical protein